MPQCRPILLPTIFVYLVLFGGRSRAAELPVADGPLSDSLRFSSDLLGDWVERNFARSLDSARTPAEVAALPAGLDFLHVGPTADCPHGVPIDVELQCVEVEIRGARDRDPAYLVRWIPGTRSAKILFEQLVMYSDAKRHIGYDKVVGPDSVGRLDIEVQGPDTILRVGLRGRKTVLSRGPRPQVLLRRKFVAGRWTIPGPDSTEIELDENGTMTGLDLFDLAGPPLRGCDANPEEGLGFRLEFGPRAKRRLQFKNVWRDSLPSLEWSRSGDTLRLKTLSRRPKELVLLRTGDLPAPPSRDRGLFDTQVLALRTPAVIEVPPVVRCLLEADTLVSHQGIPDSGWPGSVARLDDRCLEPARGTFEVRDLSDGNRIHRVWMALDSSWSVDRALELAGKPGFHDVFRVRGPRYFEAMDWVRRGRAYREAFAFVRGGEPHLDHTEEAQYRFPSREGAHCYFHSGHWFGDRRYEQVEVRCGW